MNCFMKRLLVCVLCTALLALTVAAQHISDPDFKTDVEKPAVWQEHAALDV
jgi:hypothetical protein